jgi:aldose sugar dehydrogenase
LNKDRTGFILNGALRDKVASGEDGTEQIEFAEGFGGITDLEIGPDGYLYVLIYDNEDGRIYRISPITSQLNLSTQISSVFELIDINS